MSETGADNPARIADYSRGIALTILAVLVFGLQDALSKIIVQDWSPFQVTMMRYWAFGLFALWLVSRQAPLRQAFKSGAPRLQLLRAGLLVADIWCFAFAVKVVPLAELQSISSIYPLLVTMMAALFLGEKVGIFRVAAVAVGFCGALVIIRPGGLPLDWGVLFAVLSAVAYAGYIVCTRAVAQVDSTATNMVYAGVSGLVLTSAVGMFFWEPMDMRGLMLIGMVMVTTIAAHALMMMALKAAPASVVQPFNYLALPWAFVLSFVMFNHLIDPVSMVGAMVVAGAGLVVWARERRRKIKAVNNPTRPAP